MYRYALLLTTILFCAQSHAEWFEIKAVTSYNRVTAIRPNAPDNELTIRIKNLENIEDIQQERTKVLLSGQSAQQLARDTLHGQLVWIENLEEESGIYVANIYLTYEQVVRGFAKQRMVGGQKIPADLRSKIQSIYSEMLRDLDTSSVYEDDALNLQAYNKVVGLSEQPQHQRPKSDNEPYPKSYFSYDSYYQHEYLKGIFAYESLAWYKEKGQFLPADVQRLFIGWLSSYQSAQDQRSKLLEMKIRDMTVRYELYRDFLFDD